MKKDNIKEFVKETIQNDLQKNLQLQLENKFSSGYITDRSDLLVIKTNFFGEEIFRIAQIFETYLRYESNIKNQNHLYQDNIEIINTVSADSNQVILDIRDTNEDKRLKLKAKPSIIEVIKKVVKKEYSDNEEFRMAIVKEEFKGKVLATLGNRVSIDKVIKSVESVISHHEPEFTSNEKNSMFKTQSNDQDHDNISINEQNNAQNVSCHSNNLDNFEKSKVKKLSNNKQHYIKIDQNQEMNKFDPRDQKNNEQLQITLDNPNQKIQNNGSVDNYNINFCDTNDTVISKQDINQQQTENIDLNESGTCDLNETGENNMNNQNSKESVNFNNLIDRQQSTIVENFNPSINQNYRHQDQRQSHQNHEQYNERNFRNVRNQRQKKEFFCRLINKLGFGTCCNDTINNDMEVQDM